MRFNLDNKEAVLQTQPVSYTRNYETVILRHKQPRHTCHVKKSPLGFGQARQVLRAAAQNLVNFY